MDVEKADYESYKEQFAAKATEYEASADGKLWKPSTDVDFFYSEPLKRMFISERVNITQRFDKCPEIHEHVQSFAKTLGEKLSEKIAYTEVDLDCRFSRVRTEETTLSNFLADLIKTDCEADIAIANGGGLRANVVFPAGPIELRFLDLVCPIANTITRLKMKGSLVVDALENGVSQYPKYEGRFPCVSGVKFKFDPELPSGERILRDSITMHDGSPFDMDKEYIVATKSFLALGKDGFTAFIDESVEKLPPIWGEDEPTEHEIFLTWARNFRKKAWGIAALAPRAQARFKSRLELFHTKMSNRDQELGFIKICPKVEGRVENIREPMTHED